MNEKDLSNLIEKLLDREIIIRDPPFQLPKTSKKLINQSDVKLMTYQEFKSILHQLPNDYFGSNDIHNALIKSGVGPRRLQPTLGRIVKGFADPVIEKISGVNTGPGVRYRKVK